MPSDIVEAAKRGDLVLFAGAGVSTEKQLVLPTTLYEDIRQELKMPDGDYPPFPELMSMFCEKNNRVELIRRIRRRLDYIESFPEISGFATRFHRELAPIYQLTDIITTNWDGYFEEYCGAVPIVTPEDYRCCNFPERKVFKVHGSINNVGSVVATTVDYRKSYRMLRQSLTIGSYFQSTLATKTVIMVGCSLEDADIKQILRLIRKELGDFAPHYYLVTLEEKETPDYPGLNVTPIFTDATFFIHRLKRTLIADGLLLDDKLFHEVSSIWEKVFACHRALSKSRSLKEYPGTIYCASYQDGLMHALERCGARMKTGEYSNPSELMGQIESYEQIKREMRKSKRYLDVAYVDGYLNGLLFLAQGVEEPLLLPPFFYAYGFREDIPSIKEYKKFVETGLIYHQRANERAKRLSEYYLKNSIEYYHPPFFS